jgi:4-amino-4-deoxy-L-arabinose transferase-like glycosyltransferase
MPFLQDIIHKFEVGGGSRFFRISLTVLILASLGVLYNWRGYRNLGTTEAMDAAQLGRNIAQGKGFTTLFIRPFSIYLVKKRNLERSGQTAADPAELKTMHPDIANPPVYPIMLAGLMKLLPLNYSIPTPKDFWTTGGGWSWRYQPELIISLFNQLLFVAVVVVVFLLARRLFDAGVAWLSAGLLLCSELLWRFSVSGLSTILLLLIFTGLAWCVVLWEQEIREPKRGPLASLGFSALAGALVGLGCLTRYGFGWVIIPLLGFFILFGGRRRILVTSIALGAFVLVIAPWIVRNYQVSGTAFGIPGYSVLECTSFFPENRLQRSLEPDFTRLDTPKALVPFWLKLINNLRLIVQNDLPKLGGNWITAFFFVGLLVNFRNPAIQRLRYFLLMCLGVFVVTQALGRTALSEESPEINSENLLVLMTPFALVFGVSLFFMLLDLINLPLVQFRYLIVGLFSVVVCLPMILTILPPRNPPLVYPPYYPPAGQAIATWVKEKELTMSDVPWAVAWYAQRQSVWLTLKCMPDPKDPSHENFFAINDYLKPIIFLYLTPETMDSRFLSQWVRPGERSWGSFIIESMMAKRIPPGFPLQEAPTGWLPEQLMLADWQRWRAGS